MVLRAWARSTAANSTWLILIGNCVGYQLQCETAKTRGVRTLAELVSRGDEAQDNGANGLGIGKLAEHDISAGATHRGG